ncbi:MAG TPA: hypothetical protein VLA88_06640 [Candidatus Saccharimonadales bacterium]|nr:hypothetical protein [Candidatus Saccharimonadales bacterium]
MADNLSGLLTTEREAAVSDFPKLAGGFDVRSLAIGTMASGEVTVGLASRHTNDHIHPETHKEHLSAPDGFTSMAERFRQWRRTTIGRWATVVAMTTPTAGAMAACGSPEKPAGIVVHEPNAPGMAGGEVPSAQSVDRKIIGDAACYDGFSGLTTAQQEACVEAFNGFTLDQITSLSPLDQARWALGYREKITGDQPGSEPDRLTWTGALKKERPLTAITNLMLQNYTTDVTRLAWLMQQPDKSQAENPRTWAALFGVGTTESSMPVQDAKALAAHKPAGGISFEQYLQSTITTTQLFSGAPTGVKAVEQPDGGFIVTFTAEHNKDNADVLFTYRYYPYLFIDGDGAYRELTPDDEIKILQGKPLIGAPVVTNA